MALALTVAGVDVLDYLEPGPSMGYDVALQSRQIWRCVLKDYAGVYRPARRQEVIATVDGVRVFGGVIQRFRETDFGTRRATCAREGRVVTSRRSRDRQGSRRARRSAIPDHLFASAAGTGSPR